MEKIATRRIPSFPAAAAISSVPPAVKSKPIITVIAVSVIISCIIKFVPVFSVLGSGWSVIISGVAASALGAVLFPLEVSENG